MVTSGYSDDFKRDAVHQITVRGYPVREVAIPLQHRQAALIAGKPLARAAASLRSHRVGMGSKQAGFHCRYLEVIELKQYRHDYSLVTSHVHHFGAGQ